MGDGAVEDIEAFMRYPLQKKALSKLLLAAVMAVAVGVPLGWYGFPRNIEAALVLLALSCIGLRG